MTLKRFRLCAEAVAVWIVFYFFKAIPIDAASAIGGWVGRTIGYRLPITRRARRNMLRVFPAWSPAELELRLVEMWDNLGRTAAEYSHIDEFGFGPNSRVEIVGLENLLSLRDDGKPGIFFSAHLGNWELAGTCAARNGLPISLIYRAPNNPFVNWVLTYRGTIDGIDLIPKGPKGARRALERLQHGGHLGMLVDQKMNDGIRVPFFGRDAMTAPAVAAFALKFRCPVVPAHVIRVRGPNFRLVFDPPLYIEDTGDSRFDVRHAMTAINGHIERWILDQPAQWFWLHKRWPD
jgi:KDO2-lipid IV(A) lauroyltransferase